MMYLKVETLLSAFIWFHILRFVLPLWYINIISLMQPEAGVI